MLCTKEQEVEATTRGNDIISVCTIKSVQKGCKRMNGVFL